ncbi:type II secretion system F family protein [Pseudobutyrivibrio xylanivorans]|uniref:Type II secretion system F family protein n=1 Tax=Pseudobutyrivibrio xylanivorans TaxID=185007 RepID=A0A5P6VN34_PSEXY|nr:type II secretion system F family protein [Pseudobutyrivibrio xylanivorans]QFJ54073.1 type II secretion system F family protein [Pseudobutyrivibrio xylanivorans]
MQKSHDLTKKQLVEIVLVTTGMGLGLLVYDFLNTNINFDGTIKRNDAGKGILTEDLKLEFLDQNQEMSVEVSDRSLTGRKLDEAFDKAISEIQETYLGQNEAADNVIYDLELKDSYVDGLISADWKFDTYGIISNEGKLREENIPEEGVIVTISGILYYEEERIHSFSVVVNQKGLDTLDGQMSAINRAVKAEDESTRQRKKLSLPKDVQGMTITWKKKMNYRGLQIILLGFATVAGLVLGKKKDAQKAATLLTEEKEQDYPMIVSQLSILMGAGMSFRKALERIVAKYLNGLKNGETRRAGYEEIVRTYRKMTDGHGEIQALEELGKTCECKEYRKLSMMLIQNLRKGSKELLDSLEKEEKYSFEMRKQRAVRAGEEASTKLLLPMTGMLFIVIVILVVPAVMQMNI